MKLRDIVCKQIRATLKRPARLLNFRRAAAFMEYVWISTSAEGTWEPYPNLPGLIFNKNNRGERWQARKMRHIQREPHFTTYRSICHRKFEKVLNGKTATAICLASRHGAEVAALRDMGILAVGIDVGVPDKCLYTHYGDMHYISYPSAVFDLVFCNALDHVGDLELWVSAVKRVLKADGLLIIHISAGTKDDPPQQPQRFECLWWERAEDLLAAISRLGGFTLLDNSRICYPYPHGKQVVFINSNQVAKED